MTITQWDYPQCESLGLLKMDFLGLRNLTIMDDAVKMVKANKGVDLDLLALPLDDPNDLRTALPRRHPRRLPVRRRPHALAAAPDEARQLRGHLRRLGPLPAGPDGHELAHQLRAAQERPAGDHPDPQGAGGAAPGGPGGHLRPDRLPGAGAEGRPDHRRLLARRGRHPAPRDGQEEARGTGEELRPSSRPAPRRTATATRRSRPCGTSWSPSPATPSTRRTPPRTAWSPTGPPT